MLCLYLLIEGSAQESSTTDTPKSDRHHGEGDDTSEVNPDSTDADGGSCETSGRNKCRVVFGECTHGSFQHSSKALHRTNPNDMLHSCMKYPIHFRCKAS